MNIENIKVQCSGMTDEKLNQLYNFLEEKGIMNEFRDLIKEGNDMEYLIDSMTNTIDDLLDEHYWIYAYVDYCADMREIPFWMGKERIANAIIDDLMSSLA